MPINPQIADLPRRGADGAMPPSTNPFAVQALAAAFEALYDADEARHETDEERATWGPYRGSMAGTRCDRKLYYELTRTPPSNPPGLADKYTFWLGKIVHASLQPAILEMFPGAAEVKHDLRPLGIPGWMQSDLQLIAPIGELDQAAAGNVDPEERVMVEIKSTNGFSYKMQATNFKGPASGPRYGAVLQALMAAASEGIDKVVVILLSLEKVSPSMALSYSNTDADRFMAEWHYTVSEMREHLELEAARVIEILAYVKPNLESIAANEQRADDDPVYQLTFPARRIRDPEYPAGAIIQRPLASNAPWIVPGPNGEVLDNGETWFCGYCRFFKQCQRDGA